MFIKLTIYKKRIFEYPLFIDREKYMRKYILFNLIFLAFTFNAYTQKSRIYLFDDFTQGVVLMKNNSRISTFLNYDASNKQMLFMDKDEKMILTGLETIDSVFIGSRKFIPGRQEIFLEVIDVSNGTVYINWQLKQQIQGKRGAYGQTVQGSVETIDINMVKQQAGIEERKSAEVQSLKNQNEYWLRRDKKIVKFKDKKSLLKLFPEEEEEINDFIRKNKIDMKIIPNVVELIDYCLGLEKK